MDMQQNNSRSMEILGSYFRQGLHELGSVCYGTGTAAQHPEYGMLGTKPPSMVVEGLRGEAEPSPSRDDPSPSLLETHLEQAKAHSAPQPSQERDTRDIERD
jgi:hypothetical protein